MKGINITQAGCFEREDSAIVTVTNTGSLSITIDSLTISPNSFEILTPLSGFVLLPNVPTGITIKFSPNSSGAIPGLLKVFYSSGMEISDSLDVKLIGYAFDPKKLLIVDTSEQNFYLDPNYCSPYDSIEIPISTILDACYEDVVITEISLSGPNQAEFSIIVMDGLSDTLSSNDANSMRVKCFFSTANNISKTYRAFLDITSDATYADFGSGEKEFSDNIRIPLTAQVHGYHFETESDTCFFFDLIKEGERDTININFMNTDSVQILLNANSDIIPLGGLDSHFTLLTMGDIIINSGETTKVEFEFTGGVIGESYRQCYKIIGECDSVEFCLCANMEKPVELTLRIPDLSGENGNRTKIPIILDSAMNFSDSFISKLRATVSFNATMLVPTEYEDFPCDFIDIKKICTIQLDTIILDTGFIKNKISTYYEPDKLLYIGEIIAEIPVIVTLGDNDSTYLDLSNSKIHSDSGIVREIDGSYKILDICREGDTSRFYFDDGVFINIYPNPVTENFTVEYVLEEENDIKLILSDLLGIEIAIIDQGKRSKGVHLVEYALPELSNGTYFIIIQTISIKTARRFEVYR